MNESELCQGRGAAASLRAPTPTMCLIPKYADAFLTRQANLDCFGGGGFSRRSSACQRRCVWPPRNAPI